MANKQPQANSQFHPMVYTIGNTIALVCAFAIGALIAIFCDLYIPTCTILCMTIYTIVAFGWWRDGWEERFDEITAIYLWQADQNKSLKSYERQSLKTDIHNRPTRFGWSLIMFFSPHALLVWYWWFIVG